MSGPGGIDLARARDAAREAALRGGEVIRLIQPPEEGEGKGLPGDRVTEADRASERAIESSLAAATPGIAVQGEEFGGIADGVRRVADPLDRTTNFVHGFPAVGVSVALIDGDRVLAGAIHAPFLGDTWHAASGAGARWERADGTTEPCIVSRRPPPRAVVATGFPFRRKGRLPTYLRAMEAALLTFEDLRRPGAACLDLAWVACGVFDGFFELGPSSWDVAAGALLIQEAGGVVTDWDGGGGFLGGDILAGSPAVHAGLIGVVR